MSKPKSNRPSATAMFAAVAFVGLGGALATGCSEVDVIEGAETPAVAPPTAIFKSTPAALMRFKTATFEFEAEGAASFLCKLNSGAMTECTSPFVTPELDDGYNEFAVAARDAAGNTQAVPTEFDWDIDSSLAGIVLDSAPAPFTNSATAAFSFSSDEEMTFTCKLNGGAPVTAIAVTAQTATCNFNGLQDGDHEVVVTGANQVGSKTASHEWTVDTVRPIFTKSSEVKNSTQGRYELNYVVSEPTSANYCSVSWSLCQQTETEEVPCGIAEGATSGVLTINRSPMFQGCRTYTLSTSFKDRAGNAQQTNNMYSTTFTFGNENGLACEYEACPDVPVEF